jgi:tetratricopeptide (TPR) repeat protein
MVFLEKRRDQLEKEIERQYNLLNEYDQKIGLESDPRQREQFLLHQEEVKRYIRQLEQELETEPVSPTSTYFRRNYINLVDMDSQLVGRQEDRKKLAEMLVNGGCVAILGVGGQGKTALAYSYLKPYLTGPGKFEIAIWLTIEGNGTDLTGLAERLAIKASGNPNEIAETIREHLSTHPAIVVLDNFEAAIHEDGTLPLDVEALLKRLAEIRTKSQIIITTRQLPKPYRLKVLALDGLTSEAGADLLSEQGLADEPRSQLILAAEKARGNPFALKLLADLATDPFTGDSLENMLQQGDLWDKELAERLLRKMWDTRLNEEEKRLLQILSILRPPARRSALLHLASPTTEVELRELLSKLGDKSLLSVERDQNDMKKVIGYDLHPLFRRFIKVEILTKRTVLELHTAAVSYFRSLIPSLPTRANYERKALIDIWPILEAIYHLNEIGDYQSACRLFLEENLDEDLERFGQNNLIIEICSEWTDLKEASSVIDKDSQSSLINSVGRAYYVLGEIDKANNYFKYALKLSRDTGNKNNESLALANLGRISRSVGQLNEAIEYFRQAIILSRELDNKRDESQWLNDLGHSYRIFGQVKEAASHYNKALVLSRESGDKPSEGTALDGLGVLNRNLGQLEVAISYHQQALAVSRESGDRRGEGHALGNLGHTYLLLGKLDEALVYLQQALAISRETGDVRNKAIQLSNLGHTYQEQHSTARALAFWRYALEIFRYTKSASRDNQVQEAIAEVEDKVGEETFTQLWAESEIEYQKLKNEG